MSLLLFVLSIVLWALATFAQVLACRSVVHGLALVALVACVVIA